ncbi:MAG: hypothetical protein ACYTGL_24310 [Planctomycetota bacterium]
MLILPDVAILIWLQRYARRLRPGKRCDDVTWSYVALGGNGFCFRQRIRNGNAGLWALD